MSSQASSQATKTSITLNREQNDLDFEIDEDKKPLIFKRGLFSKTLDPAKSNPELVENYRIVTVKCLFNKYK